MSLADDVITLRSIASCLPRQDAVTIDRVLPLLTKLGELTPEQAREMSVAADRRARSSDRIARQATEDVDFWRADAAAERTAAEVFKMLGGG